jgi:hypothetical protein
VVTFDEQDWSLSNERRQARKIAVESGPKRNIRTWLQTQPAVLKEA